MGCQHSGLVRESNRVFGVNGLHVGRHGDVDLTDRSLDVFGLKFIELIRRDRLHTAQRLHLSDNKLYTLGKDMTRLPYIEELYINSNRFERLPVVLGEMPNLRLLNASMNPLGHSTRPLDVLPRIPSLTKLMLRDCSLTTVPQSLLNCAHLQELDLSDNIQLELGGVEFGRLPELRRLLLANCGIMGQLPDGVKDISTLEALDVSSNYFDFEDPAFFGKKLPATLTELHLRGMELKAVPQVIASLRLLTYLDLAENALETLDVLAGRLVRKLATRNVVYAGQTHPVAASGTDANDDATSVASHGSTRVSLSQLSRAGCIAFVPQPIPLTKLSLRACDLRTLPKYFHKLTNLVDIDLSENEHLDDPNMTLFSFANLQVLNIVGCPFAEDSRNARNEWFDIAKLRNLRTISWEVWKGVRNMSPYRTKIPIEICGLRLRQINEMTVRDELFVGDTVQTIVNLLLDGYFKVDLALGDDLVYSYAEALHALQPLESFFFPGSNEDRFMRDAARRLTTDKNKTKNDNNSNNSNNNNNNNGSNIKNIYTNSLNLKSHVNSVVLQIVINRYIFFLTLQAANYNFVIIPPADVIALHYAQMTQDPLGYRRDCEAICGQVLSCNYRLFFIEQRMHTHGVKDAMIGSRRVWNTMVRATQKDLQWLRYDFWERRVKRQGVREDNPASFKDDTNTTTIASATADADADAAATATTTTTTTTTTNANASPVNTAAAATAGSDVLSVPAAPPSEGVDTNGLQQMDTNADLRSMLDLSITAHFMEQGLDRFAESLRGFFYVNRHILEHEEELRALNVDWTRYVKYLALHAYIQRRTRPEQLGDYLLLTGDGVDNNSFCAPDEYLPRPLTEEALAPLAPRRPVSVLHRFSNPVNNAGSVSPTPFSVPPGGGQTLGGQGRRSSGVPIRNGEKGSRRGSSGKGMPMSNPVPTIGLTLLLYTHRTAHVKYYQTLILLGLENIDVTWENTKESMDATMKAWKMLYNEKYVEKPGTAFIISDALENQKQPPDKEESQQNSTSTTSDKSPDASVRDIISSIKRGGSKRFLRNQRQVTLCCADSEYGVF